MNIERIIILCACGLLAVIVSDYALGMEGKLTHFIFQVEPLTVPTRQENDRPDSSQIPDRQALAAYQATLPGYPVKITKTFTQIVDRQALAEYQATLMVDPGLP